MLSYNKIIASELGVREQQVEATVGLLDEGATIPFISRYRKEVTGTLDEVQVATIRDRVTQLRELDKRREAILKSLEEMGKLSDELKEKLEGLIDTIVDQYDDTAKSASNLIAKK